MIGIFKTNISTPQDMLKVIDAVSGQFPVSACTVDLEDCDKVLRVVYQQTEDHHIINFVRSLGYQCAHLD